MVSVCVDKANAILELDTMDIDGKEIQPENYDIRLSNVSFSYDKRKLIDDISLSIPQKTTTAIVGPVSYTHLDVYKRQKENHVV